MTTIQKTAWTHKVVKFSRGMDGKFFAHKTAITGNEAQCIAYAASFAREQNTPINSFRISGHEIRVIPRKAGTTRTFKIGANIPAGQSGEIIF